jgi:hypothetical protein
MSLKNVLTLTSGGFAVAAKRMIPKASTRGFTNMVQSNVKPGWSQVGARPSTRTDNDNENDEDVEKPAAVARGASAGFRRIDACS